MEGKMVKRPAKKPESVVTLKQRIMRLQNKTLFQENRIFKLGQQVLHLKAENEKLQRKIDSPDGLMATVVAALEKIKHDEPPK